MKQKKFDRRNLKASTRLNRFDLSNRTILTAPFGALIPCMVRHVLGNSRVRLELENQIRVNSLNSPAFSRMRQHFDYFFVPYSQLYRYYDNFKTQQSNYNSALYEKQNPDVPSRLPYFTGQDMSELLYLDPNSDPILDVNGYDIRFGHRRLFDLLRYGNIPLSQTPYEGVYLNSRLALNPFAALAYQKIYFDYFRNDKFENNDSEAYNIDDFRNGVEIDTDRLRKIFTLRYRWRRKDYFTQVTPDVLPTSKQFGRSGALTSYLNVQGEGSFTSEFIRQFSVPGFYGRNLNISVRNTEDNPDTVDSESRLTYNTAGSNVNFDSNINDQSQANLLQQSVTQHRLASARQKLLERMYAAHSDFSSQMLAIFGYAPAESRFGNVKHIGGFSDIIQIADVDNNTPTRTPSSSVFGKINNVNSSERYIDYTVPEDGVLMCIFSTDILQDYDSYRLDRFNFKNVPEDFFNPYYENLGKQALYSVEYSTLSIGNDGQTINPTIPSVIGFVPRYSEYKHVIDEVHGEFCKYGSLNYMSAPTNVDFDNEHPYLYIRNLILNPSQLDSIVPVNFNGEEETDVFQLNLFHSVKVLAPLQRETEF